MILGLVIVFQLYIDYANFIAFGLAEFLLFRYNPPAKFIDF